MGIKGEISVFGTVSYIENVIFRHMELSMRYATLTVRRSSRVDHFFETTYG